MSNWEYEKSRDVLVINNTHSSYCQKSLVVFGGFRGSGGTKAFRSTMTLLHSTNAWSKCASRCAIRFGQSSLRYSTLVLYLAKTSHRRFEVASILSTHGTGNAHDFRTLFAPHSSDSGIARQGIFDIELYVSPDSSQRSRILRIRMERHCPSAGRYLNKAENRQANTNRA